MDRNPVPWIGLLALVAMFVIPFLPDWVFEGPRTVRHWPRRHVCGDCGAPWTRGHVCEAAEPEPVPPARGRAGRRTGPGSTLPGRQQRERLVGELRRLDR
jgi:hypothetical protein